LQRASISLGLGYGQSLRCSQVGMGGLAIRAAIHFEKQFLCLFLCIWKERYNRTFEWVE